MKWLVLFLFGALGLAALTGGLIWAKNRYDLTQRGVFTRGTVVGQHEEKGYTPTRRRMGSYNRVRTGHYPIVEFTTNDGQTVRVTGTSGGSGAELMQTGTQVGVIYDPNNPSDALIVDFTQAWLGPLVLTVAGALFLLMAIGSFYFMGMVDRDMARVGAMMEQDRIALNPQRIVIDAKVDRVEETGEGRQKRYVLVCVGKKPGTPFTHEFRSEPVPFDPGAKVVGKKVKVYLDPEDEGRYLVEVGGLL